MPASFSDLRNISCTPLFSKFFESFVLQFAKEEIALKKNQYGGVKGCSTSHLLIDLMQSIYENSEDYRSASVITAIDYSKAFNRLSFQHCLEAFRRKGASTTIIRLLATFLTNRTMTLRVGESWSDPKDVCGGCPQGSILGVFLFNVTTDDLEDDFVNYDRGMLGLPPIHPEVDQRQFVLNENVRNVPFDWVNPPVESKVGTQVLVPKPVIVRKYVDDNLLCEKVNFGSTPITDSPGGPIKERLAPGSQNAFRSIVFNAEKKKMVVNADKTNMICVSDSLNYTPRAFFTDSQGERVESGERMKVLGFHLSNKPNVALHVREVCKALRRKNWMLYHLKKLGFNEGELVKVYSSVTVPSADYCDVVYHSWPHRRAGPGT